MSVRLHTPALLILLVVPVSTVTAFTEPRTGRTAAATPAWAVAASVKVINEKDGKEYCGSGTVVDVKNGRALVLTCKHLFEPGQGTLRVNFPDGSQRSARLVGQDDKADIAAVVIRGDGATPRVPVASAEAKEGETLFQVGYPGGEGPVSRAGECLGFRSRTESAWNLHTAINTTQGDSGSGLFRSDRTLAGVLWGYDRGECFGSGTASIRRFLVQLKDWELEKKSAAGSTTASSRAGRSSLQTITVLPPQPAANASRGRE
jgi:S1-C subfamily serine protease